MEKETARLISAMAEYDSGDPMRIHHFLKVHDFATAIAVSEGADEKTTRVIEAAAVVHDIGIHISEEKYNSSNGKYQEKEGPAEAEKLLKANGGYTKEEIERIKYIVGHHHTYTDIDGIDYQIIVEADFLVNLYEDNLTRENAEAVGRKIFKTEFGKRLLKNIYLDERKKIL